MPGRRLHHIRFAVLIILALGAAAIGLFLWPKARFRAGFHPVAPSGTLVPADQLTPFQKAVLADLDRQIHADITYRDGYFSGGDPPSNLGVCTDVVIRSFRAAGVDLQQEVARDVAAYPHRYHITRPDLNIDHRRCRNLVAFFKAHAQSLPTGGDADWQPGDIVFWDTDGHGLGNHVGMIANGRQPDGTPAIIHHPPPMAVSETDGLFRFPVTNHFRWPERASSPKSNRRSGR